MSSEGTNLLAVIEVDRSRAVTLFKQLSPEQQLTLVRSVPLEQQYDVLTLADDATELVQSLSVPELHTLITHEGLHNIGALVKAATPEQTRGVMDFSCWRGEDIDEGTAYDWLAWLNTLTDEEFVERVNVLDPSFVASVVGPHMEVDTSQGGLFAVYDTKVKANPHGFDFDDTLVENVMWRLYALDDVLFNDLLNRVFADERTHDRATRAGLEDQLAEAQTERARRLRKLDLDDTHESRVDLLRPLVVRPAARGRRFSTSLPERVNPVPMFDRIINLVSDPNAAINWRNELAQLGVKVLMAHGGNPGERRQLREATQVAASALNVALDALSGGSVFMAEVIARTWSWVDLFRVGNTFVERIRAEAIVMNPETLIRKENAAWLLGLIETPVRVYDPTRGAYRHPNCIADIVRAHREIGQARKSNRRRTESRRNG